MKNKIQKLIVAILITVFATTNSFAGETYAGKGALLGTGAGAGIGLLMGVADASSCGYDSGPCGIQVIIFPLLGVGAGAILGLAVGSMIPKQKLSVSPLFSQSTTEGTTAGGMLEYHF